MAYLFWPMSTELKRAGYEAVANVPFIIDSSWSYNRPASRYLRERALAEWSPRQELAGFGCLLTEDTLETYGECLCDLLEWLEAKPLSLVDVEYNKDILNGYQQDMRRGHWSSDGHGLSARTVTLRTAVAVDYLNWTAARGIRAAFSVPRRSKRISARSGTSSYGQHWINIEARDGRVRPDPKELRLPNDLEMRRWLRAVKVEKGPTKETMCDLVVQSAIRREEAVQWRVDTLPLDRSSWRVKGDNVELTIRHGTKGPKSIDERGEKTGPPRQIGIPIALALKLEHYREFIRPRQREMYVARGKDAVERRLRMNDAPKQLFLSDSTGQPISAQSFYEAWTKVSSVPYVGWSPHLGRDYWACKTLLSLMAREARAFDLSNTAAVGEMFRLTAMDIITMVIQPQLGHAQLATTQIYLTWVHRVLALRPLYDEYEAELESLAEPVAYD
jgi:integrase